MPESPSTELRAYAAAIRMLAEAPSGPAHPLTKARDLARNAAALLDDLADLTPDTPSTDSSLRSYVLAGIRAHTAEVSLNEYDEPVIVNGCNYADDLLANLTAAPRSAAPAWLHRMRESTESRELLASVVRATFAGHDNSTSDPDSVPRENDNCVVINPVHPTDIDVVADVVDRLFGTTWWANNLSNGTNVDGPANPEHLHFAQACTGARVAAAAIQAIGVHGTFRPDLVCQTLQDLHEHEPIASVTVGRMINPIIWIQIESESASLDGVRTRLATAMPEAVVTARHHGDPVSGPILSVYWP